jgi:threonine dehydrogenase-like Zn-dependent dehydrogenase
MRAVACRKGELEVVDLPALSPGEGQVLLDVVRCGICGSDLHARYHCDDLADVAAEMGYDDFMRMSDQVVMGHEFSGRVASYGPGTRKKVDQGAPVVALPLLRMNGRAQATGLSTSAPGAYAEQVLVDELLMMPVPGGLDPAMAALTEPMAIGLHAVRRGEVKKNTVAIVIGCGPIGLAVICALKASGVKTVVASDFSAARRSLATVCGADVVVDPAADSPSPYDAAGDRGFITSFSAGVDMLLDAMTLLRRLPLPWHHVMRTAEKLGAGPKAPVIFECVGVPGIIDGIMAAAPLRARIVVVGVCMGVDRIRPSMAINKEIELRFVLGYSPVEFRDTLHMLADKTLNATPLVTGTAGLDGVESAFTALADPDKHAKVLIDPASSATL